MITVRKASEKDLDGEFRENMSASHSYVTSQWAFAIVEDERVVALVGCVDYWRGVGHVWASVKDGIEDGLGFTRAARKLLKETMSEFGYHRIQTFVDESYRNRKWARICGFECEALLENMAEDGNNLWLYKLIRRT